MLYCVPSVQLSEERSEKNKIKKVDKWNFSTVGSFLNLYERHPCLWDFKMSEYKDINVKDKICSILRYEKAAL